MIDIFISKPTWIPDEFKKGLNLFDSFLRTAGFNGRTLGVTDYPTESPMNEVLQILDDCMGTVVLGIPQIQITSGKIKGNEIQNETWLATEWNHIEAALAYSKKMPLLVLNHSGVSRGIFDRGTLNSFIYSIDMKTDTWASETQIEGAIQNWKKKVTEYQNGNFLLSESSNEQFEKHKGVLFQKLESGKFDDTVFCPKCKTPMFSMEDFFPFSCGQCGTTSTFKGRDLDKILQELNSSV